MAIARQPLAVYPGSFDPFHMGHVDIVARAIQIFPRVVVGVLENTGKDALFSPPERGARSMRWRTSFDLMVTGRLLSPPTSQRPDRSITASSAVSKASAGSIYW